MPTAATEIRALTAPAFTAPAKFRDFCRDGGKPLGGLIDGEPSGGSMNATFQTIDPGSQEVLATVSEMGRRRSHGTSPQASARFRSGSLRATASVSAVILHANSPLRTKSSTTSALRA